MPLPAPEKGKFQKQFSRFQLLSVTGSFIETPLLFHHSLRASDRIQDVFADHESHSEKKNVLFKIRIAKL